MKITNDNLTPDNFKLFKEKNKELAFFLTTYGTLKYFWNLC
jgi:hypothetical protein